MSRLLLRALAHLSASACLAALISGCVGQLKTPDPGTNETAAATTETVSYLVTRRMPEGVLHHVVVPPGTVVSLNLEGNAHASVYGLDFKPVGPPSVVTTKKPASDPWGIELLFTQPGTYYVKPFFPFENASAGGDPEGEQGGAVKAGMKIYTEREEAIELPPLVLCDGTSCEKPHPHPRYPPPGQPIAAGLNEFVREQMPLRTCARKPVPARFGAPPEGASHDDGYCFISVTVNSFETCFPGALRDDVRLNPKSWDELGDKIGHTNTGVSIDEFVDQVNKNFRDTAGSLDGRRYCAAKLEDKSAANVAAYTDNKFCNGKLAVHDSHLVGSDYNHVVDIEEVQLLENGKSRILYKNYDDGDVVEYDDNSETLDFSRTSALGSPWARHLQEDHPDGVGDGLWEGIDFVMVCRCEDGNMPTMNPDGRALRP